jgi:hypothetical protein
MPKDYFKLGHDRFLPHACKFIIQELSDWAGWRSGYIPWVCLGIFKTF